MPDLENIILSVLFFGLLCGGFYFWRYKRKNDPANNQRKYMLECLNLAKSQFEYFTIKKEDSSASKNSLTAMLLEINKDGLHMQTSEFIDDSWNDEGVEVYFRARHDSAPIFYMFSSLVKRIKADYEESSILLAMPDHLRVEKKRHFIRVQPQKEDIRVIGVWAIQPGRSLPRSTNDMGAPITHYKPGMTKNSVQMENISASGLALRFPLDKNGKSPVDFNDGSQLLCLVVYSLDEDNGKPTAFWCTGEIMNSRKSDNSLILGLEYTNWAILEQGTDEIHWAHSSPSRGVRPILKWVEQIDKKAGAQEQVDKKTETEK